MEGRLKTLHAREKYYHELLKVKCSLDLRVPSIMRTVVNHAELQFPCFQNRYRF